MKRSLTILAAAVVLASVPALANSSSFGVTVNFGLPLPVLPVLPVASAPIMVLPSAPGMSLVMGVPYDLVYSGNRYYPARKASGTAAAGPAVPGSRSRIATSLSDSGIGTSRAGTCRPWRTMIMTAAGDIMAESTGRQRGSTTPGTVLKAIGESVVETLTGTTTTIGADSQHSNRTCLS